MLHFTESFHLLQFSPPNRSGYVIPFAIILVAVFWWACVEVVMVGYVGLDPDSGSAHARYCTVHPTFFSVPF
jgi:hypothetical protein